MTDIEKIHSSTNATSLVRLFRSITIIEPNGAETAMLYDEIGNVTRIRDPLRRVTHFEHDEMSNQISERNPEGGRTYASFDASNRMTREVDPLGNVTQFRYDALGRLTSQVLPNGGEFSFEHDKPSRTIKEIFPSGEYLRAIYDERGDRTETIDQIGRVTTYTFDIVGRQLTRTDALGGTEVQTYDERGNLSSTTTPLGYSTYYEYDLADRRVREIEPSGLVTAFYFADCCSVGGSGSGSSCCSDEIVKITQGDGEGLSRSVHFEHDVAGNIVRETDQLGNSRTFEFDNMGNVVRETDALGNMTVSTFDLANQRISERDERGHLMHFQYDNNGNMIRMSDPLGRHSRFAYDRNNNMVRANVGSIGSGYSFDAVGNLSSRTNGRGHTTTFEYDEASRQRAVIDGLGGRESFIYGECGNMTRLQRANGQYIDFEHDALNRLVGRITSDSRGDATFVFDKDGRRTSMTDITGTTRFEHDSMGRIISATSPCGSTIRYEYDLFSNITAIIYPDGSVTEYEHDAANRLTLVRDSLGNTTRYFYDDLSRVVRVTRSGGLNTYVDYDASGNLTSIVHRDRSGIVSSFRYTFDASNRIVQEVAMQDGVRTTSDFRYDGSAQLSRIVSVSGTSRVQTDFDYDLAGNRVRATISERGRDRRVIDYSYNEAGELVLKSDSRYGTTAFGFDRSGNNVSQARTTDGVSTITNYSFDALGRLEAIDTGGRLLLAVLYDGDNNRVMSASRNPDPEVAVPDGGVFFAAVDVDSEEETRTADLDEDATGNHTPNVRVSEHDLFWYGVAQGMSNLSHMATYLTQWLNSIWTLDLEATRHDFVSANQRESHARELVDLLYVPDGVVAPNYEIDTELYTVTRYINDTNRTYARTLTEYDEDGTWRTNFIYDTGIFGVNGVIGMNNIEGSTERFLTDGRGSVTEMVAGRGDITTYRYDAFGNIRTQGDSANPFTYNQERFDFGVELQYLRARYVDLGLGRFVSRDSVLGTLEDPRTHNLFLYVANDPLSHVDPSGHVMVAGSGGHAGTVRPDGVCPRCNNGRNVPGGHTRCPRCGSLRIPTHPSQYRGAVEQHRRANNAATNSTARPPSDGRYDWVNRAIMAAWKEYFKNSNSTPARNQGSSGLVVDWARSEVRSVTIQNRTFDIRRDAREMSDVDFAMWAIALTSIDVAIHLIPYTRVAVNAIRASWAVFRIANIGAGIISSEHPSDPTFRNNVTTFVAAVFPGGFAITERRSRLVDATMNFTVQVTYDFRFSQPSSAAPRIGVVLEKNRSVSGRRMFGTDAEIRDTLRQMEDNISFANLARTSTWYREALR